MKKLLLSLILALVLVLSLGIPALAEVSEEITVTYTPAFISISTAPTTWEMNSLTGDSKVRVDTIYYSNPGGDTVAPSATVVDGECRFTTTNTSNVAIDVTLNMADFSGGTDPMVNSNGGSNGVGTFGAYGWYSGMTYSSKVITQATGSAVLMDALAATTDLKWGIELETQSDAWIGITQSSGTLTISIMED